MEFGAADARPTPWTQDGSFQVKNMTLAFCSRDPRPRPNFAHLPTLTKIPKDLHHDSPRFETPLPRFVLFQDPLEFPAHELKKYFKMGDHVKVLAGRYEGDTGLIVRVEDNMAVLFSDLTMHEVSPGDN